MTTLAPVFELGGHSPVEENVVGSLLTDKLSEASRARNIEMLQQNSHWPDQTDEAECSRRGVLVFASVWRQF